MDQKRTAAKHPGADHRILYTGLIRLHVLHHAVRKDDYGLAMIKELRRHGYELSAGTLYPILHGLEEKGLLTSVKELVGSTERRMYRTTAGGREALIGAKAKVRELLANCSKMMKTAKGDRNISTLLVLHRHKSTSDRGLQSK